MAMLYLPPNKGLEQPEARDSASRHKGETMYLEAARTGFVRFGGDIVEFKFDVFSK